MEGERETERAKRRKEKKASERGKEWVCVKCIYFHKTFVK